MRYNRNENIYELTSRLSRTHNRNMLRYASWITLCAGLYLGWTLANVYWKVTTGHTLPECAMMHSPGCETQSIRIHGE